MSNITVTNVDRGTVVKKDAVFQDGLLTVGGAVTVAEGTLLAIDSSTLKFVPFVIGGSSDDNGTPRAVLTYDVTSSGAGDVAIRAMVSGVVRKERLIEDGDGDASNLTEAHYSALRANSGIVPEATQQLGVYES